MQVQQLFLGATWLKAEAEFVRAWHAVGEAVRVGQEIGKLFFVWTATTCDARFLLCC